MSSSQDFADFVVEQMENVDAVTVRKMFGEFAIYSRGKIFGLICDNKLFLKPTKIGKKLLKNVVEMPPYPGAKPYFLIEEELENREFLGEVVTKSLEELPDPKPKKLNLNF